MSVTAIPTEIKREREKKNSHPYMFENCNRWHSLRFSIHLNPERLRSHIKIHKKKNYCVELMRTNFHLSRINSNNNNVPIAQNRKTTGTVAGFPIKNLWSQNIRPNYTFRPKVYIFGWSVQHIRWHRLAGRSKCNQPAKRISAKRMLAK